MALQHATETTHPRVTETPDYDLLNSIIPLLEDLDLSVDDLKYFEELSPYLIR